MKIPRGCLTALAVALALGALAPAAIAAESSSGAPEPVTLGEGWEFRADPADAGEANGWHRGRDSDGWSPISVPHVLDSRPLEQLFYGSVGWYRLRFTAPETPAGYEWAIHFEQVRRQAAVWLNGRQLGTNSDPYTPFTLRARNLRPGRVNELVVRADSRKGRQPREGWWNWGGITRPVTLMSRGTVEVRELGLLPKLRCAASCNASVLVDAVLENHTERPVRPRLRVHLSSPSGRTTSATVRAGRLEPGEVIRVRHHPVAVQGTPALWSPDRPRLYDAKVETVAGDRVEQVDRLRIGLRSIRVRDGLLHLNGRALRLSGASIQEDADGRGAGLSAEDVERIVTDLKDVGANVTRAHYLLNERLLSRLDEEGILVWSQAPVYHRDGDLRSSYGREEALGQVRRTVLAARNHPSVLTHSVANELSVLADRRRGTRIFLEEAAKTVRDLDPQLPVSVDILSYPGYPRQEVYESYDLLGINSYFGWYRGKPGHSTERLEDLEPYLQRMRRLYPRHAMALTEFGAEATYDGPAGEKETYAFQADFLARILDIVDRTDFVGGAIYWTLGEFAVKPRWDGGARRAGVERDGIHNKGLIAYDGTRKPAWDVARERFRATPLYRSSAEVRRARSSR